MFHAFHEKFYSNGVFLPFLQSTKEADRLLLAQNSETSLKVVNATPVFWSHYAWCEEQTQI